jgi:WD40 repeat protein
MIASSSTYSTLRLWQVKDGRLHETPALTGATAGVICLAFSPDGKTLASGSQDARVRLWDVAARKELASIQGHTAAVSALAFSPDGRTLASGGGHPDDTVRLWDVATRKALAVSATQNQTISALAFAPDGIAIVASIAAGPAKVLDARTAKDLASFEPEAAGVAFAPDGKTLATGGSQAVTLRNVGTWKAQRPPLAQTGLWRWAAFTPDGKVLVSANTEGLILSWDVATETRSKLHDHQTGESINGMALAPDGRHVVTANVNGTVYVLRLAPPPVASR